MNTTLCTKLCQWQDPPTFTLHNQPLYGLPAAPPSDWNGLAITAQSSTLWPATPWPDSSSIEWLEWTCHHCTIIHSMAWQRLHWVTEMDLPSLHNHPLYGLPLHGLPAAPLSDWNGLVITAIAVMIFVPVILTLPDPITFICEPDWTILKMNPHNKIELFLVKVFKRYHSTDTQTRLKTYPTPLRDW